MRRVELDELEEDELSSIEKVREQLKQAGCDKASGDSSCQELFEELFVRKIEEYLNGEPIEARACDLRSSLLLETKAIEALDQRLLAKHHVLLEDLSPELLEEFLTRAELFEEGEGRGIEQVRQELYGHSRLPVLTSRAKKAAAVQGMRTSWRRQLVIEARFIRSFFGHVYTYLSIYPSIYLSIYLSIY